MEEYLSGRMALSDFLAGFGIDLKDIPSKVAEELLSHDLSHESVWAWCEVGRLFGTSQRATPILCALLSRDDHQVHEDLADTLQDLREPGSVACLFDRVGRRLPYLEYNDNFALARKCVWALHDIGTPEAVARLKTLADDPREEVSREVAERLDDLRNINPSEAKPSYRVARDNCLGPL